MEQSKGLDGDLKLERKTNTNKDTGPDHIDSQALTIIEEGAVI